MSTVVTVSRRRRERVGLVPRHDRLRVELDGGVLVGFEPAEGLRPPAPIIAEILHEQPVGPPAVVRLQRRLTPRPDVLDPARHRLEVDDGDGNVRPRSDEPSAPLFHRPTKPDGG